MQTATILISESSRRVLREISQRDNKPMQALLEQAVVKLGSFLFLILSVQRGRGAAA